MSAIRVGLLGSCATLSILKENTANYISLERLINVAFEKVWIVVFFNSANEIANNRENDHASFKNMNY